MEQLKAAREELRPCPLCGASAVCGEPPRPSLPWVECSNADCNCGVDGATLHDAIARWDRRSLPEARPGEVGEAIAYLQDFHWSAKYAAAVKTVAAALPALLLAAEEGERMRKALEAVQEHRRNQDWERLGYWDDDEELDNIIRTALSTCPAPGKGPPEHAPIVPPDDDAIEWARELDAAATEHDQAKTQADRAAASWKINNLIMDDERMVQMARALLARLPAEEK